MSVRFFKKPFRYIALLVATLLLAYLFTEPLYTPTALISPQQKLLLPQIIAHKALISGRYPGNTAAAIKEALQSPIDGIELDLRLSKDKIPFIFHADLLEESTNGYGRPEDKTWKELSQLRYSSSTSSESYRILSLNEVLAMVGSDKYLFLDIKEKNIRDNGFVAAIASLIHQYQLQDTVVVESFNPVFLTYLRLQARDILIMYDFTMNTKAIGEEVQSQLDSIPWLLKQSFVQKQIRRILRPDLLGPHWNVDSSLLQSLARHGYPLIAWTVDSPQLAKKLFALGITGVQSNKPLTLNAALGTVLPNTIEDAGGTANLVAKNIVVKNEQDVLTAIAYARQHHLSISIAGRRHSMGGQSMAKGSLHLDMLRFNKIHYNPDTQRVTVQAGASWSHIQKVVNRYNRALIVIQSDTIFTAGGTVSVNAHGWQVGMPPIGSTVESMKVVTADGKIRQVSLRNDPELFKNIIGGYGLFAIILEIELNTAPNSALQLHTAFFPSTEFKQQFQSKVSDNPNIELAYGRLSIDKENFLQEAGLFWFEETRDKTIPAMKSERFIAIKRALFRAAEYSELGKKLRWTAEKNLTQTLSNSTISRNTVMSPDIHLLWPVRQGYRDILHEYFIPKAHATAFIAALRARSLEYPMNLLNVTIREVRQDNISSLPYAQEDVFAFVLFFSQEETAAGEKTMQQFTGALINDVLALGGSFYLPYRLHYSWEQLAKAYPMIDTWLRSKTRWDPESLLSNQFYQNILRMRSLH